MVYTIYSNLLIYCIGLMILCPFDLAIIFILQSGIDIHLHSVDSTMCACDDGIDYTFIPNDVSSPGRVTKKLSAMLSEMEEDRQKVFMHKVKAGASSVSVKREDDIFYVRDINEGGFPAGEPGPGFAWAWRLLWPEGEESWCPLGLYIVCTKKVTVNGIVTVLVHQPSPST